MRLFFFALVVVLLALYLLTSRTINCSVTDQGRFINWNIVYMNNNRVRANDVPGIMIVHST